MMGSTHAMHVLRLHSTARERLPEAARRSPTRWRMGGGGGKPLKGVPRNAHFRAGRRFEPWNVGKTAPRRHAPASRREVTGRAARDPSRGARAHLSIGPRAARTRPALDLVAAAPRTGRVLRTARRLSGAAWTAAGGADPCRRGRLRGSENCAGCRGPTHSSPGGIAGGVGMAMMRSVWCTVEPEVVPIKSDQPARSRKC